jgi:hypothetical protein
MANASITNRLIVRLLLVFALAPLIAVVVLLIEGSGRLDMRLHAGREREVDKILAILLFTILPLAYLTVRHSLEPVRRLAQQGAMIEPGAARCGSERSRRRQNSRRS